MFPTRRVEDVIHVGTELLPDITTPATTPAKKRSSLYLGESQGLYHGGQFWLVFLNLPLFGRKSTTYTFFWQLPRKQKQPLPETRQTKNETNQVTFGKKGK